MNSSRSTFLKLYSGNTLSSYECDLSTAESYFKKDLSEVEMSEISDYKKYLLGRYSSATANRKLGTLKRYYEFLCNTDVIDKNPMRLIRNVKIVHREERCLERRDVENMILKSKNSRDRAIIATLASTGLRVSELIDIKISDIDSRHNVRIVGKGDKPRLVHLNDTTMKYIDEYMSVRKNDSDGYLFTSNRGTKMMVRSIQETLKNIGNRAGVENMHPHKLRHYLASELLDRGVDMSTIQTILGHSNITTTQIYAEIRDKRIAVEKTLSQSVI